MVQGIRARVRAEMTAEIKASGRKQLALEGASSLSLRAIARELDMASSAIYRYFASRDELLTALIIDAYDAVGAAAEEADAARERTDYHGRFTAISAAIRDWALANPHEYALIYGSPVPGYAAPEDTIDPASRVGVALLTVCVERWNGTDGEGSSDDELRKSLADIDGYTGGVMPPEKLARAMRAWGEIIGLVSLELFGHFNNVVNDKDAFFARAMDALATEVVA